MKNPINIIRLHQVILFGLCFITAPQIVAQEDPNLEFSLGMVFTHFDNPLRDTPTRNLILPSMNFTYYSEHFFIDEEVGYTLWEREDGVINLITSLNLDFIYFLDTGQTLDEISYRRPSVLGGVELLMFPLWGELQIQLLNDITGVHDGQEFVFSYRTEFDFGKWQVVPKGGFHWKSSRLTNYYYGAHDNDGGFPSYSTNAAINWFAALDVEYPVEYNWIIGGFFHFTDLASEIAESPIVQKRSTFTASVGVKYVFR